MNGEKINGVTEKLADSPLLKAIERVVILLVGVILIWVGATVNGMQITITEVRTTQKEAIVPGVQALNRQVGDINHKMLEHKWFGRDDAERMDDQHRALIEGQDRRLRALETKP